MSERQKTASPADFFRGRSTGWWVAVGFTLALAFYLATADWSEDVDESSGDMARVMCEGFVEDRLKSPGSADFQRPSTASAGTNTWLVSGSVDSENSFGATMRLNYECTVRGSSGGEWTLIDLQHSQR